MLIIVLHLNNMIISLSSITLFCFYINAWFAVSGYFDEDYTQGIFNGIAAIICYVSNRFLKRYEEMIDGEDEEWQAFLLSFIIYKIVSFH